MSAPRPSRREFFRAISLRAKLLLMLGIFTTFAGLGGVMTFTGFVPLRPLWLATLMPMHSGVAAVLWALSFMWSRRLIPVAIVFSALVSTAMMWFVFSRGYVEAVSPRSGAALAVVIGSSLLIIGGYVCFVLFVQNEVTQKIRMRAELDLAQRIHESLVPPIDLDLPGVRVHARSFASSEMGGDLIDAVQRGDRLDLILADVSGHGVRAGVVMGMLKAALRSELLRSAGADDDLGRTLDAVNEALGSVVAPGMFATLAALRIEGASVPGAGRRVIGALAGHPPILRIDGAGAVHELPNDHLPLALSDDERYASFAIDGAPGDLLVLYTDGLTEAADEAGAQFGHRRLGEVAAARRAQALPAIADALFGAVRGFSKEQLDDQTLLLVRLI